METNDIWRVKLQVGYTDLMFDFDNIEDAGDFLVTAAKTFNQKVSYDNRELLVNMTYFPGEVTDD